MGASAGSVKARDLIDFNPITRTTKDGEIPFIEMAALPTDHRYIPEIGRRMPSSSGSKFKDGDTLFARITPCLENGKGGFVAGLGAGVVGQGSTEFIVFRAKDPRDEDFVYYLSRLPEFRLFAEKGMSGTSGRQRVAWQTLAEFTLLNLDPDHRQAMGAILSSLDDKIELNRQMNQTLEEMARAVFLDWFVDFGPTRRKTAGINDPAAILGGLIADSTQAAPLAALFPDSFGANGLPMGWEVRVVSDDFDVEMGQSPPGSTYNETGEGLPFFQGRRDFQFRFPEKRVYCSAPTRTAEADWTLISVRAPVGDINRAWEKCCIGRGVGAMMHKKGLASFTYYVALHLQEELASYDKDGTVFGSINQKQIKGLSVNATNSKAAKAFDDLIAPMDEMIRNNTKENQTLAATRDLLLPKLMSGELRLVGGAHD